MTTEIKFTARLPADLKAMLKKRADANRRSINGELVAILEHALTGQREAA